ncbi:hypothetical protein vseg_018998 [Gypsophila vaccaria]
MCSFTCLEIKIRYVEGLTLGKKPVQKNVFVTVSTEDQVYARNNQISTGICEECETSNPTWNEKLTMMIPIGTKYIVLDVYHRTRSKEKSIATARVPTSDFIDDYITKNYVHFLSYRLRDSYDESNGIINFCVNVKGNKLEGQSEQNYSKVIGISGYDYGETSNLSKPCNGRTPIIDDDRRRKNDVVVGIPHGWFNAYH